MNKEAMRDQVIAAIRDGAGTPEAIASMMGVRCDHLFRWRLSWVLTGLVASGEAVAVDGGDGTTKLILKTDGS